MVLLLGLHKHTNLAEQDPTTAMHSGRKKLAGMLMMMLAALAFTGADGSAAKPGVIIAGKLRHPGRKKCWPEAGLPFCCI